ncbi:MAG: endonuclease V [Thermoprotei archaeon]
MSFFDHHRASVLQEKLSKLVDASHEPAKIDEVVGLDLSYVGGVGFAVATLHKYSDMSLVKYSVASDDVHVPYVPGLLAFREAPLMFVAYELLNTDPDLILVNGHGITHPRFFGIASHVGVVLNKPTIGVARRILSGREVVINGERYLESNGVLGAYVVVRGATKVYLSIGHKVSLRFITEITPKLFRGHELPEPIYTADRISKQVRSRVARAARG